MKHLVTLFFAAFAAMTAFTQNVGIGVNSPTRAKLEVYGTAAGGATSAMFGSDGTGISLQRNWPTIGFNQYHGTPGVGRYMAKGYAAAQYLDPNSGGLYTDLYSSGAADGQVVGKRRVLSLMQSGDVAITGGDVFLGNGNSNIGINTSSPVYSLEIRQANKKGLLLVAPTNNFDNWELVTWNTGSNPAALCFNYNGVWKSFIYIDGEYVIASDKRVKKNIQQLSPLLNKILQLQPITYEMTHHDPENKRRFGFLAQDVRKLFPELVHVFNGPAPGYDGMNDLHMMNYSGFGVLAIQAVKEQQKIIEEKQQQINELKARLDRLEKLLVNR